MSKQFNPETSLTIEPAPSAPIPLKEQKSVSTSFKVKIQGLAKEFGHAWFSFDEKALDSSVWGELDFNEDIAAIIYSKLILLCKMTRIQEENNNLTHNCLHISDWQLYLLSGNKLPLEQSLNPESAEGVSLQSLQQGCLLKADQYGRNALYYAALGGCVDTLKYLLEEKNLGQSVQKTDRLKSTFIPYAAVTGLLPFIASTLALDFIARELTTTRPINPFHAALFSNDKAIIVGVLQLMNQQENHSVAFYYKKLKDASGRVALNYAAIAGTINVIPQKYLTEKALTHETKAGHTALDEAIIYKKMRSIEQLLKISPKLLMRKGKHKANLLFLTALGGNVKIVAQLLKIDKDHCKSEALLGWCYRGNILTFLASENKFSLFSQVFAAADGKFDINYQQYPGETPTLLTYAILYHNLTAVKEIIQHKINYNIKQNFGGKYLNALQIAAAMANPQIIATLIQEYKIVPDFCGNSAGNLLDLVVAALPSDAKVKKQNVEQTVETLLRLGADPLLAEESSIKNSEALSTRIDKIWIKDLSPIIQALMGITTVLPVFKIIADYLTAILPNQKGSNKTQENGFAIISDDEKEYESLKQTLLLLRRNVRVPLAKLAAFNETNSVNSGGFLNKLMLVPSTVSVEQARKLYQETASMDLIAMYKTFLKVQPIAEKSVKEKKEGTKFLTVLYSCIQQLDKYFFSVAENFKSLKVFDESRDKLPPNPPAYSPAYSSIAVASGSPTLFYKPTSDAKIVISPTGATLQQLIILSKQIRELKPTTNWKTLINQATSDRVLIGAYKTAFATYFSKLSSVLGKETLASSCAGFLLGYINLLLTQRELLSLAQDNLADDIARGAIAGILLYEPKEIEELIQTYHQKASCHYLEQVKSSLEP